jgi:hypothetical protein
MLVVAIAAIIVTNLPDSEIKTRLFGLAQPLLNATGLDQDWSIFSPNPRGTVVYVEGRVDYANGTSSV